MSGKAGKTTLTKILAYLRDFFAEAAKTVFSINNRLPDANGNVDLQVVPGAQQLVTDEAQESDAVFDIRTTGGDASIGDGTAVLMQIRGNAVHTGAVQEVIQMTLTLATREEGEDPITAALDEDVFRGAVSESGTTTLLYTAAWSEDPAGYGVTVTGTPMAGDVIAIEYVKGDRGTIRVATPSRFRSTGYNLYDHSKGYAFVKKYSASYGFLIAGDYAAVQFSETEDGARTPITPAGGYFNVPGDGYVWVTGGNGTNTEIYMTWSDWVGGRDCAWKAYEEDEIDLSGIIGEGMFFPWGMARVGSVYDEIDTNSGLAISRIERMPYSAENLAAVIAAGRGYDADTDYIYVVRETPVQADVAIDGAYAANDHGMELFDDTDAPVGILVLYGENLVDKLRRDVVTKSQDIVNGFTSTATDKALSAAAGKTLNDNITSLNSNKANYETGTWQVGIYDLDSKLGTANAQYMRIGGLYIVLISLANLNYTFNTMFQIRDLPYTTTLGGTLYITSLNGQGANATIQASSVGAYFRPNITGNVTGSGTILLIGSSDRWM